MAPPAPQPPLITRLRDGWRLLLTVGSLLLGASLVIALLVYTAYRRGVFEPQMQADGQVMLHLRVSVRYRGVVSPASSVRITQDLLIGDQRLTLTAAPRPASAVPDRFLVAYSGRDGLEDLLARGQLTLQQLDRLLDTVERLAEGEVAGTLAQLRGSLRSADALVGTLEREVPPTAAVLRQTGREAGSTVREVRLASSELVRTLVQVRPALSRALLQVDDTGEQAQTALIWLNQLIDRLDPGYRLRRQGPQPRPDAMAPESGPPAVPAPAAPTQSATP
jgi:ABC-type transporter Mla subunit MlaD